MLSAPSLVEEEIGGLGADRLLVSQGHRRIVEVPVTVQLVLPVGGVCEKRSGFRIKRADNKSSY